MNTPITQGIHHLGLTVSHLEESTNFFIALLGWKEVRRNLEYPAIYVSDGVTMVSLWGHKESPANPFAKNKNVGHAPCCTPSRKRSMCHWVGFGILFQSQ
jgi:catechol 2,3-dioxygenase-like lactoylglutathione lyase family enzyme